jgi:hypothetical protein
MTNEELDALVDNLRSAISGGYEYSTGVAHHQAWCTRILFASEQSEDAITALRQERDEALKANSMLLKAASDVEEQRDSARAELAAERKLLDDAMTSRSQLKAERDRLQLILDSRPAINTGLLEAYIEWTQGVYLADIGKAVGHN